MLIVPNINYGGTLVLTNLSGTLAAGDSFRCSMRRVTRACFQISFPAIPALNLAWNTNGLTNGVLSVISLPTTPPQMGMSLDPNSLIFSGSNGVPGWPYCM